MPFTIKLLGANRVIGAATTPLYAASGSGGIVSNVRLANTGGAAITINLYFTPSGGSQTRLLKKDFSIAAGAVAVVKPELTMAAADKIELVTVAGTTLDFVVAGTEKV